MEKITKEEVLGLWDENDRQLGVYIHSPFCKKLCSYCAYQGCLFNKEEYQKYYNEYLPQQIKFYTPLLEKNIIESWFFGGGTPNLMDASTMDYIFSLLPKKFIEEGERTIEIHPAYFTDEQLSILQKYNFTSVILGIQSFNQEYIKRQNRDYASKEEIAILIKKLKQANIKVAIDLIMFLDNEKFNENIESTNNDLEIIKELMPNEVSIAVNYKYRNKLKDNALKSVIKNNHLDDIFLTTYNLDSLTEFKNYRFFDEQSFQEYKNKKYFTFINYLDEELDYKVESNSSTLGIGDYKNKYKHTFSQINQKYLFIEKNENWVPTYYILYKDSFFDQMRKLIDYLESIGEEPPKGSYLLLQNVINGENSEFEDFFTKQISINWNIYSRIYNTNEKFLNQYEENKNNKYFEKLNQRRKENG